MPRGGFRPGSGRPKGTTGAPHVPMSEKDIDPVRDRIAKGIEQPPLDTILFKRNYWMRIVMDELQKPKDRQRAKVIEHALDKAEESAVRAARYVHPSLSSVEVKDQPYDLTKLSDAELSKLVDILQSAAGPSSGLSGTNPTQH